MSQAISIAYELHPPAGSTANETMQTCKSHGFSLKSGSNSDQQEYYKSLRDAVSAAKAQIGADLTEWRDAVGSLENAKEPKKGKKSDEEEDDEEGDNEEGDDEE